MTDEDFAVAVAGVAGRLLLDLSDSGLWRSTAKSRIGDMISNSAIMSALALSRPDDGALSEESRDSPARLDKERVWIVDPLDGSREYGEDRDDWSVHVGLALEGVPAVGVVALPARATVLRSDAPPPLPPCSGQLRIVVSRSHTPTWVAELEKRLHASLIRMGSAGAKTAAVLRGEAHAYVHSGGQWEWDSCAPVAVARAAGLDAMKLNGETLIYNKSLPIQPDLIIGHPSVTSDIRRALRDILGSDDAVSSSGAAASSGEPEGRVAS